MIVATVFTNFGPYHLARLRALAHALSEQGDLLIAYEMASNERTYPWARSREAEPFVWITLFPYQTLEAIPATDCAGAMVEALNRDLPDVIAVAGYARPECTAAAAWGQGQERPVILMSESQRVDRPRTWWKELFKRTRIKLYDAALVGGPSHAEYLRLLGMQPETISLGYNAVDNAYFQRETDRCRQEHGETHPTDPAPYFLSVCRFVPEKNLPGLIQAYVKYRQSGPSRPWNLVLCGDGPQRDDIARRALESPFSNTIHLPGFLQAQDLVPWYAHAGAFVLPSVSEPWGLVVNEAASASLPLLVSSRAGCAQSLVPLPHGMTGAQFDPNDPSDMARQLTWMAGLDDGARQAMGRRAAEVVAQWGPERFAQGMLEAISRTAQIRSRNRLRDLQETRMAG